MTSFSKKAIFNYPVKLDPLFSRSVNEETKIVKKKKKLLKPIAIQVLKSVSFHSYEGKEGARKQVSVSAKPALMILVQLNWCNNVLRTEWVVPMFHFSPFIYTWHKCDSCLIIDGQGRNLKASTSERVGASHFIGKKWKIHKYNCTKIWQFKDIFKVFFKYHVFTPNYNMENLKISSFVSCKFKLYKHYFQKIKLLSHLSAIIQLIKPPIWNFRKCIIIHTGNYFCQNWLLNFTISV